MLDDQRYKFLGDVLLATALAGPGEHDDSRYAFLVAYWDAKVSEH